MICWTPTGLPWSTVCSTSYVTTVHPAVAGTPPIPAVPGTPGTTAIDLLEGWNSSSRSVEKIGSGQRIKFTVLPGSKGVFVGLGNLGKDGRIPESFDYGLMLDASGVKVFENGVVMHVLAASWISTTEFTIARYADVIRYAIVGGHSYTSTKLADVFDLYAYGMLYRAGDTILSALIEAADSAAGSGGPMQAFVHIGATVSVGFGVVAAVEQDFTVHARISNQYSMLSASFGLDGILADAAGYSLLYANLGEIAFAGYDSYVPAESTDLIASIDWFDGQMVGMTGGIGTLAAAIDAFDGVMWSYAGANLTVDIGGFSFIGNGHVENNEMFMIESVILGDGFLTSRDMVFVFTSSGVLSSVFTDARVVIADMVQTLSAASVHSTAGLYPVSMISTLSAQSSLSAVRMLLQAVTDTLSAASLFGMSAERAFTMTSMASLDDSLAAVRVMQMAISDSASAQSIHSTSGTYHFEMASGLDMLSLAMFGVDGVPGVDATSAVWVVNLDTAASTQYARYGFNSFFVRDGVQYGVADDGIYRLDGDSDAGASIDSQVSLGSTRFGSALDKRVPAVYVNASSSGRLILKVEVDGGAPYFYEARSSSAALDNHRIDPGRGLIGNNWTFTLLNQAGDDFELSHMEFVPLQQGRRI